MTAALEGNKTANINVKLKKTAIYTNVNLDIHASENNKNHKKLYYSAARRHFGDVLSANITFMIFCCFDA